MVETCAKQCDFIVFIIIRCEQYDFEVRTEPLSLLCLHYAAEFNAVGIQNSFAVIIFVNTDI